MKIKSQNWRIMSLLTSTLMIGVGVACNTTTSVHKALPQEGTNPSLKIPMTQEHLLSYQDQVISKYAAKLNWYNQNYASPSSTIDINEQISIMKHDFATYKSQNITRSLNDDLQDRYAHIHNVSKQLGINVADTFSLSKEVLPQEAAKLQSALVSQGVNDAYTEVNEYRANVNRIINRANNHMWTNEEYAIRLAQSESTKSFVAEHTKGLRTTPTSTDLQQALTILQNDLGQSLKAKESNAAFVDKIKDYAFSGIYDTNVEINPNDFKDLFTFDYDITTGADLGGDYAYDITNSSNDKTGSYSDIKWTQTQDFGRFDGIDCTLIPGEFLPGYLAHIRIIDKDTITDSHKCSLKLQFGVSNIIDTNEVIWSDLSQKTDVESEQKTNGVMDISLKTNEEQIKYISKNTYYQDAFESFSMVLDNADDKGRYFNSSIKSRPHIDIVIQNAWINTDTGEYDFTNHPLYIPINEVQSQGIYEGLPIPKELQIYWDDVSQQTKHTNQTFALKISGESTDNEWLEYQWCIVDKIEKADDYFSVKDIPWNINGNLVNTIRIGYELDDTIKSAICNAIQWIDLFVNCKSGYELVSAISDEKWSLIETKYWVDTIMADILDILCILSFAIQVTLVVLMVLGQAWAVKELVFGTISCLCLAAGAVLTTIFLNDQVKSMNNLKIVRDAYKNHRNVVEYLDEFLNYVGLINNHHSRTYIVQNDRMNIASRKQAADEIDQKKTEIFQKEGFQDFLCALGSSKEDVYNVTMPFNQCPTANFAIFISSLCTICAGCATIVFSTFRLCAAIHADWLAKAESLFVLRREEIFDAARSQINETIRIAQGTKAQSEECLATFSKTEGTNVQYEAIRTSANEGIKKADLTIEEQTAELNNIEGCEIVAKAKVSIEAETKTFAASASETLSLFAMILMTATIAFSAAQVIADSVLESQVN